MGQEVVIWGRRESYEVRGGHMGQEWGHMGQEWGMFLF